MEVKVIVGGGRAGRLMFLFYRWFFNEGRKSGGIFVRLREFGRRKFSVCLEKRFRSGRRKKFG